MAGIATTVVCEPMPHLTRTSPLSSFAHFPTLSIATDNLEDGAKRLISLIESRPVDFVECEVFAGAYTNLALKATSNGTSYVIRIYGAETSAFVNREEEVYHNVLFDKLGLGPRIVCVFENGVCNEFINAACLCPSNIVAPSCSRRVAQTLASLHVKGDRLLTSLCQERIPLLRSRFLTSWLDLVPDRLSSSKDTKSLQEIKAEFGPLPEAAASMLKILERSNSPVLLCHNDLCCGNILMNSDGHTWLVDMEYTGVNYRGFDIAGHFCEFAGVAQPDYSLFPSRSFQMVWMRAYLEEEALLKGSPHPVRSEDVEQLHWEVMHFVPACHLMWAIWSLFQAKLSKIDYDYLHYARLRFVEYRKHLSLLLDEQVTKGLP